MARILVCMTSCDGPRVETFRNENQFMAVAMGWLASGCDFENASAWKLVRNKWVPMFPWQLQP